MLNREGGAMVEECCGGTPKEGHLFYCLKAGKAHNLTYESKVYTLK